MERDAVDEVLAGWAHEWPELDVAPTGVIARLRRAARHLERELEQTFASYGLGEGGFAVLATLRRAGPPYRLSPTELAAALRLSTAAMTNRLDRLEAAGLIARSPHPEDRRGILVTLTTAGREVFDRAAPAHQANQRRLLGALNEEEQGTLAALLRRLLLSFEDYPPTARAHAPAEHRES